MDTSNIIPNNIITENECPICYDELTTNTITLPCNHVFHNSCMSRWIELNNNLCPYCRYDLTPHRAPNILDHELIVPDGNIDDLNVDNFHYFYYLNRTIYTREIIEEFIDKIKQVKQIKSTLLICENYNINSVTNFNQPNFGKLIWVGQITCNGVFSCGFQTDLGIRYYPSNYFQFTRSN
jgi:hypothetical protein